MECITECKPGARDGHKWLSALTVGVYLQDNSARVCVSAMREEALIILSGAISTAGRAAATPRDKDATTNSREPRL